jgi:hypothetical protein
MKYRTTFPLLLVFVAGVAAAKPLALEPFKSPTYAVSLPKGWTITSPGSGVVAAQQDPKRKDAAAMLLSFAPNTNNVTEDQLLDFVTSSVAKDVKVQKREGFAGGGHVLVADGVAESVKVRIAAVAVANSTTALFCVLVAKTGDFDGLGGLELVTSVLASIKPDAPVAPAPAPTPAPAPPQPAPAAAPSNGRLEVPAPTRRLTVADFAGEWGNDDSVVTTYVSTSTGAYAGYQSIATSEKWRIDAKGGMKTHFHGVTAGNGGAHATTEDADATLSVSADGAFEIKRKGQPVTTKYLIRGWLENPDVTIVKLNGPYYADGIPDDVRQDPHKGYNLDSYWVRKVPAKSK